MEPFEVHVPDAAIEDLKTRLGTIRWPGRETVADDSQGVRLVRARMLADHWLHRHDWRKFERRINRYPQYRVPIDGLMIHFIHVRSPHPDALPVLLTHGWPGSIVEFLDCIEPLTDPVAHGASAADAFDVIIPSIPGFGFSEQPTSAGWNAERTARAWGMLMHELGYTRWFAQGGDWGSLITHRLAQLRPEGLAAAHVNLPLVFPREMPTGLAPQERQALDRLTSSIDVDGAYAHLQGTRPQTMAYGLADSPIAQATWMLEKIDAWTQGNGLCPVISLDAALDNISLYWFTNSGASSARFYWEVLKTGFGGYSAGRIELPMAATIFPGEFYQAPRTWAEQAWPNLFYWNEVDRGGHFAAWEQPRIFAEEVRKAFRAFRRADPLGAAVHGQLAAV